MSFIESPRFPEKISLDATGGPSYLTDVVVVASGAEQRNQVWAQARHRYEVAHAAQLPSAYKPLQAFFHAMGGMLHAFRYKDWLDYQVPEPGGTGIFQMLTPTTFQMYKRYTSGSTTRERKITKPVSGTVTVTGGSGVSVNYATGIVTVSSGTPTSWTGEFDVPCRFGIDQMEGRVVDRNNTSGLIINWDSIPIVEIRV